MLKKMHQKRRYFLGAIPLLLSTAGWAAEPRKQVLLIAESNATNTPQVPYNPIFQQAVGYVEKELNLQFEYRRYPWKRLLQSLNEGEGLAFGLSKTRERALTLHFSLPAFATHVWLVVRSDQTFSFSQIADLQGKTVGMVRGSTYGDEFDRAKSSLLLIEDDLYSLPSRLKKLLSKRTDVMLFSHHDPDPRKVEAMLNKVMPEIAPDTPMPPGVTFKVLDHFLAVDYIHFAILASKDDGIIEQLNKAIRKGQQDGSLSPVNLQKK
ncbi:ABC-type amino acid transport substrate-binding protein [Undibacterium pigrum]|uniref:ABC-type amino acid transport substrate-binding protein n=2 Tax=Undibacterium pigrum TaxID=401470 RepID=A0A318IX80_9BURK|nr:ABC-type amino acid transport substrate-binding protein [Undibacterium pigrum]